MLWRGSWRGLWTCRVVTGGPKGGGVLPLLRDQQISLSPLLDYLYQEDAFFHWLLIVLIHPVVDNSIHTKLLEVLDSRSVILLICPSEENLVIDGDIL